MEEPEVERTKPIFDTEQWPDLKFRQDSGRGKLRHRSVVETHMVIYVLASIKRDEGDSPDVAHSSPEEDFRPRVAQTRSFR